MVDLLWVELNTISKNLVLSITYFFSRMGKIKLFHSYIYIQNSKNIKNIDNKLYDKFDNFIIGLLNILVTPDFSKLLPSSNKDSISFLTFCVA